MDFCICEHHGALGCLRFVIVAFPGQTHLRFGMSPGTDLGFLERGFVRIKVWGVRFAGFISFFLNIP